MRVSAQRRVLSAALVAVAIIGVCGATVPALAECPTELGQGIRLETRDRAFSVELRPGARPDLIEETRRDTRQGLLQRQSYMVRALHHGMLLADLLQPVPAQMRYASPPPAPQALLETGAWQAEAHLVALARGETPETLLSSGDHAMRVLGHGAMAIGGCRYEVIHIEHLRRQTRVGAGSAGMDAMTYHQWYAPGLGISIGLTAGGLDGSPGALPEFTRIRALP